MSESVALRLGISLFIGLLIGTERERRKGSGPRRAPAGIRSFALASLTGGISMTLGGGTLLAVIAIAVAAMTLLAYTKTSPEDPGVTTELALLTTTMLGALAIREPTLAAGLAVVVAILLAGRNRIHRFVRDILTEQELHDALLLAGASLVILPLTPNRPIGPFQVLNLRVLWALAVMIMMISSAGYVALRTLGPRIGLPLTGFTSGFVSSVATIGSMGTRVRNQPRLLRPAVAGAVFSTLSTVLQMSVVLGVTDPSTLAALRLPLLFSGAAAALYAVIFMGRSLQQPGDTLDQGGRAFSPSSALTFAVTVSSILFVSAAIRQWLGSAGLVAAAALTGLADTHATAIAAASLVAAAKISAAHAAPIILIGFTTNTMSKIVAALTTGGRRFAFGVIPGLIVVLLAAWLGWILST